MPRTITTKFQPRPLGVTRATGFLAQDINDISILCHQEQVNLGWWHDFTELDHIMNGPLPLVANVAEKLCLIHSEISEAMEGARKDLKDDKLPHRMMFEVELADALIRILDLSAAAGLDLGHAVQEKLEYNRTRTDHQPANRALAGGKKF